jgi:hypothetical protein
MDWKVPEKLKKRVSQARFLRILCLLARFVQPFAAQAGYLNPHCSGVLAWVSQRLTISPTG